MATPKISVLFIMVLAMVHLSIAQNSPEDYLEQHNAARANVGVKPLVWNKTLEEYAENYSTERSTNCNMVHSNGPYGENLALGSGDFGAAEAVKLWVDEKKYYNYEANICVLSDVGCLHYTQVVWNTTTDVGCGRVLCKNLDLWFITCSYYPRGNYIGNHPY
ncbi:pathogenesis-related protein PRB1-2-like [Diospyros lotus]|uniref:pathogenesis-related protein PRB1-2-like n=1 Tax=Diospyros lotus TaxID=55363 RepID=UPI002250B731|nr:pathogenesis-related protein PRB1-2-like [Diospyros lotus]